MPELERWDLKAMKRVKRFQNTDSEAFINSTINGAKGMAKKGIRMFFSYIRPYVIDLFRPAEKQVINGKSFRESAGLMQPIINKIGTEVADSAMEQAEATANTYLDRDYCYPAGKSVADAAYSGRISFDKDLSLQMYNACGYVPNFDETLKNLYNTAAPVDNSLTDNKWRKEVTPHMLRYAYQQELEKSFDAIRKQHLEKPDLYNRRLAQSHMETAARHLGRIFEKFSLDLANNTDYLEAPVTLFPKKPPQYEDVPMSDKERKLLAGVSRHSLFPGEKALQKQLSQTADKLPKLNTQETLERFHNNLVKPVLSANGEEIPYRSGEDIAEDTRRLVSSILNLREMKQRYEKRNFFSRHLTRAGREEQAAIEEMQNALHKNLGVSAEQIRGHLSLKTPLEESISLAEIMGIQPKKPEGPSVAQVVKDTVIGAAKTTGSALLTVAGATLNLTYSAFSGILSAASTALNAGIKAVYGDPSAENNQEQAVVKEPVGEESVEENPVAEESIKGESVKEESVENKPAEGTSVENKSGEEKLGEEKPAEEKPAEEKPAVEESSGITGALWNIASGALSYLNPLSYFGSKQPELASQLQQVQAKQTEVIGQLKVEKNLAANFLMSVATLIYLKTLEVSLRSNTMDAATLEDSLTKKNIYAGAKKIQKDSAFLRLEMCTPSGIAKRARQFSAKVESDPSIISDLHKEYMHNLQNPTPRKLYECKPAPSKKAPSAEAAPKEVRPPFV